MSILKCFNSCFRFLSSSEPAVTPESIKLDFKPDETSGTLDQSPNQSSGHSFKKAAEESILQSMIENSVILIKSPIEQRSCDTPEFADSPHRQHVSLVERGKTPKTRKRRRSKTTKHRRRKKRSTDIKETEQLKPVKKNSLYSSFNNRLGFINAF